MGFRTSTSTSTLPFANALDFGTGLGGSNCHSSILLYAPACGTDTVMRSPGLEYVFILRVQLPSSFLFQTVSARPTVAPRGGQSGPYVYSSRRTGVLEGEARPRTPFQACTKAQNESSDFRLSLCRARNMVALSGSQVALSIEHFNMISCPAIACFSPGIWILLPWYRNLG